MTSATSTEDPCFQATERLVKFGVRVALTNGATDARFVVEREAGSTLDRVERVEAIETRPTESTSPRNQRYIVELGLWKTAIGLTAFTCLRVDNKQTNETRHKESLLQAQ